MTLRHLKIFAMVCECSSVTKAASKLHLSQPAVSLAIRQLEDMYGIVLFDRIGRQLSITEQGKLLLDYAQPITAMAEEMERQMGSKDSFGMIKVGSSVTIGTHILPTLVADYEQLYPDIDVRVVIDKSDIIEKQVLDNVLDFGLIEGFTHGDQFIEIPFQEDHLVVVCSQLHPHARKGILPLDEIKSSTFLLREHGSGTRELIDSTLLANGIKVHPVWESISTDSIVHAVARNLGISILPEHLVSSYLQKGILKELQIEGIEFNRQFRIIYHNKKYLSQAATSFMKLCMERNSAN